MLKPMPALALILLLWPLQSLAQCRDVDAIAAGETLAKSYFKKAEIFHKGYVQKVHNPSGDKEVAAYVKTGNKHYSIFSVVNENCQARFIKRTRQND